MLSKADQGSLFKGDIKFEVSKELNGDEREYATSNIERYYRLGTIDDITKIYSLYSGYIHGTLYRPDKSFKL